MSNPFNPLDWLKLTQDWFAKTEKSSGFRPYLIYQIVSISVGLALLFLFPNSPPIQVLGGCAIALPIVAFIPLFAWKAHSDPDFCRSETHVQKVKKLELEIEMLGSESKQVAANDLDQRAITEAKKEPDLIEGEIVTSENIRNAGPPGDRN